MSRKKGKTIIKKKNSVEIDNGKTKFQANQSASAFVGQGGNAFAINANELGVIRIRPGGQ